MQKNRSRSTLKDVANAVGVSINAVSIVLNNTGLRGQVSLETRQRILEAAKELSYQPNLAARSLVTRRSNTIGLYCDYELNTIEPFTSALIFGASRACRERRQALILYGRRNEGQTVDEICAELLSGTSDGLMVASWTDPELLARLQDSYLPVVQYPDPHPTWPSVVVDRLAGSRLAVEYLKGKGHQRLAYRALPSMDGVGRADAYAEAAQEFGVSMTNFVTADAAGRLSEEERRMLSLPRDKRPTAIACWNDEFAYRILDYCDEVGLRVPDDIAIVGYDGAITFPEPKRRLTTIFVPWGELAFQAVMRLVDINDDVPVAQVTDIPTELWIGDTA
jgi:LacI family transcriptional regulator